MYKLCVFNSWLLMSIKKSKRCGQLSGKHESVRFLPRVIERRQKKIFTASYLWPLFCVVFYCTGQCDCGIADSISLSEEVSLFNFRSTRKKASDVIEKWEHLIIRRSPRIFPWTQTKENGYANHIGNSLSFVRWSVWKAKQRAWMTRVIGTGFTRLGGASVRV